MFSENSQFVNPGMMVSVPERKIRSFLSRSHIMFIFAMLFLQGMHPKDSQGSGGGHQVAGGWCWGQSGKAGPGGPVLSVHHYQTGRCGKTGGSQLGFRRPRDPGMDAFLSASILANMYVCFLGKGTVLSKYIRPPAIKTRKVF